VLRVSYVPQLQCIILTPCSNSFLILHELDTCNLTVGCVGPWEINLWTIVALSSFQVPYLERAILAACTYKGSRT
jgi:hypothetical protein